MCLYSLPMRTESIQQHWLNGISGAFRFTTVTDLISLFCYRIVNNDRRSRLYSSCSTYLRRTVHHHQETVIESSSVSRSNARTSGNLRLRKFSAIQDGWFRYLYAPPQSCNWSTSSISRPTLIMNQLRKNLTLPHLYLI